MDTIYLILLLSVLGPVLGSLIGVLRKPNEKFMFNMLAFAAGVMLSISFLELIPESIHYSSSILCAVGIIIGGCVIYFIDKLLPHIHPELCTQEQGHNLKKTSIFLIAGIFLHNFPEGMAIAIGSVSQTKASIVIALAIAIHNIPEGICTSAPYYHCTGKRLKSFLVSASTAIPVLVGFFFAKVIFKSITSNMMGIIVGSTAGLMIYICVDELIPTSCCSTEDHSSIFSLIAGVIFVVLLGLI